MFTPDPRLPWPPASAVQYPGLWPSTKAKRKCVVYDLEPHLTCENVKQCTIDDVLSASFSMLECMIKGFGVREYTKHVKFLVDKSRVYSGQALIKYDQSVREKAEMLGPTAFVYGDHELYYLYLGLEQLNPRAKSDSDCKVKATGKTNSRKGFGTCWRYNDGRPCQKQPCPFMHECSECGGNHKQTDCSKVTAK